MNSTSRKTSAATRFSVSRAHFSPVTHRQSGTSPSRPLTASVRLLTPSNSRAFPSGVTASGVLTLAPTFWSSGELDRLQPEVTRYHD